MVFHRPRLNLGYVPDKPEGINGLPELIEFNATHNPEGIFGLQIRAGEGSTPCLITFASLQIAVERCCAWLVASGTTNGRSEGDKYPPPVGILLGSDITIFIYMAALLRLGTPVLCLSARLTPVAIAHLLRATSASSVLFNAQVSRLSKEANELFAKSPDFVTESTPSFVDALGYEDFLDSQHPGHRSAQAPPAYFHKKRHELGAVIMHSSGTTGLPKPIYHAPSYLLVYAACHRMPKQDEQFAYNVSTLPLYHGFGLLAPSLALSIGMPFVLPPASVIPTARSTLAALTSIEARSVMSVPSIVEDMLKMKELNALSTLQALDFIAIGGAPMKEHVGQELVANGVKLLNHWGATEIGAIALVQPLPADYDWHYLIPRDDIGLEFELVDAPNRLYRLIGHPQGWDEPFCVQDSLEMHPTSQTPLVRILGRTDDLIVLVTGEKVLPATLEKAMAEHPAVKDVLAFGDGRPSLGLLVEISEAFDGEYDEAHQDQFLESLKSYVERGNSFTDSHGKIAMSMIVFTKASVKPLLRTDKGSLARKANYAAFEEEINQCYNTAEVSSADPLPKEGGLALREAIRALVSSCSHGADFASSPAGDFVDFFEAGMDSLQATRLRGAIQNALRVTPDLPDATGDLALDFCFQYSSVDKLTRAVSSLMNGLSQLSVTPVDRESRRVNAMHEMLERYVQELYTYSNLAAAARACPVRLTSDAQTKVVLLTGSTGSLGCFLLAQLAADPAIGKVLCLNRPRDGGTSAAHEYQIKAMEKRGVIMDREHWRKVVLLEAQTSQGDLGLSPAQYQDLFSVTHIIHNAWPVDFNRSLSSLESHVRAVCNLIQICLRCAAEGFSAEPARLIFASSIAVVGRHPIVNPSGPGDVPEVELDAQNTDDFGYPEAKWVCEKLLLKANELFGMKTDVNNPLLRTSSVRIGQMTGPEGSGAWNETEHFPILVRTSQMVKALPHVEGSLSWLPVNRAAAVITELLFSSSFRPIYHMENPSRQSWDGILGNLALILGSRGAPLPIVPFATWLDRVRTLGDDQEHNYALKVMHFLEHDFIRMASGKVILRTANAKLDSTTMVYSTSLDRKHLEEYCAYWKKHKFLT